MDAQTYVGILRIMSIFFIYCSSKWILKGSLAHGLPEYLNLVQAHKAI